MSLKVAEAGHPDLVHILLHFYEDAESRVRGQVNGVHVFRPSHACHCLDKHPYFLTDTCSQL